MNRIGIWLAAAAVALLLAGCASSSYDSRTPARPARSEPPLAKPLARLEVDGLNVRHNGSEARDGATVRDGDIITTGPGSSARIVFVSGGYVQLDENTDPVFRILGELGCIVVEIATGQAFVDARRVCISDSNVGGLLNSRANWSTNGVTTVLTVLEGSFDVQRPTRTRLGELHQYTVTRGDLVRSQRLSPDQAAATAAWTTRYFRPVRRELGWCCRDGRLSADRIELDVCRSVNGIFFEDRAQARRDCKPRAPASGWCCTNGKLSQATPRDCQRLRGTFHEDERKAKSACVPPRLGWCCTNGRLTTGRIEFDKCRAMQGHFHENLAEARRACATPPSGWCCSKGGVTQTTPELCGRLGGKLYRDQKTALASCPVR